MPKNSPLFYVARLARRHHLFMVYWYLTHHLLSIINDGSFSGIYTNTTGHICSMIIDYKDSVGSVQSVYPKIFVTDMPG